jgi:hypothetical protein
MVADDFAPGIKPGQRKGPLCREGTDMKPSQVSYRRNFEKLNWYIRTFVLILKLVFWIMKILKTWA